MTPRSHRFAAQGLDLHYLDWGGDAPTVILVHGGRDHAHSWDAVAQALRPEWRVVAPDLRGHGDSGRSSDGASPLPHLVADLARLVEVVGGDTVRIVGHSFGGAIALHYAGCFPERVSRLAAIEGLRPVAPETPPTPEALRHWITRRVAGPRIRAMASIEEAATRLRANNDRLGESLALDLARHGVRREGPGYRWKFDPAMWPLPGCELPVETVQALWAAIACPVWLVHGARSWAGDPAADGRAAHFRDATVTSFADAGHWVHHDRPDAFIPALKAFLA